MRYEAPALTDWVRTFAGMTKGVRGSRRQPLPVPRKQHFRVIHRPVQHMQHGDAIRLHPIEHQVAAVHAVAHAAVGVALHEREALGELGETEAGGAQLLHEGQGAGRIVARDRVGDPFRGAAAMHAGIDLAGPTGTPIHATADGVVSEAAWNNGGYGRLIKIDHGRGIETRYAHLSSMSVSPGQRVTRGQVIGRMGSTGRSTGSHLHYEVRIDGRAVNPIPFMKSTDYLLAMQKNGGGAPMDGGHVALGGPKASPK